MEHSKKSGKLKSVISAVYLIAAVCLLLGVCGYCYPETEEKMRQAIAGVSDSPVREAFSVLADGLGDSRPMKDVFLESYEVLTGEAS